MNKELNEYVDLFFSYDNPVYYSIILALSLFVLVYVFYKYIILPLQKKHILEKQELELKNARLMALFAELDPDPVIRIDTDGKIIHSNDAAKKLNNLIELDGRNVREILPQINFPVTDYIRNNQTQNFFHAIDGKYYSILFRGTSYLDIAQIYFRDLTERKKFEEELEESRKRLKDLSAHLQDKLEEERQRISRELHDSVGQNLLLIKLRLQNINLNFIKSVEKVEYSNLIETLENSIKELKSISYDLKPRILEEMGLGPALTSLCNKISKESGIKGSIEFVDLNDERFNTKMEISFYRIVQEALNNIVKHSKAEVFDIQLINNKEKIRLLISDDGVGIFNSHRNGLGLINMKERVENYNGKFKIDSSQERGTLIIVEIPKEEFAND